MRRTALLSALLLLATTVACRPGGDRSLDAAAGTPTDDSIRRVAIDSTAAEAAADSTVVTTTAAATPAVPGAAPGAAPAPVAGDPAATPDSAAVVTPAAGAKPAAVKRPLVWPAPPTPLPGAHLPAERIVAFYGNPLTTRLGILGRIPPAQMLDSLAKTARAWQRADTTRAVRPALHLIAAVAAGHPGKDGKYRTRMSDATIEQVAKWAEEHGWLMFVDLQPGQSTVRDELAWIKPWLARPYVHLALDPEFAMSRKPEGRRIPGKYIGTMDAADINEAQRVLAHLVDSLQLPPKVLVVHRFTDAMLTNAPQIARDPRVQVVIDMDGFGSPALKKGTWRRVIQREPVQYTGWKLFLNPKNDKPMMTPEQVLEMEPAPVYIQYQ
ncbi:MAG TPA: hypothetical protein VFS40_00120 [Gemmatimonadales bacterium]|nr:hypothetical protein [Gemmatimonadales bacterium]